MALNSRKTPTKLVRLSSGSESPDSGSSRPARAIDRALRLTQQADHQGQRQQARAQHHHEGVGQQYRDPQSASLVLGIRCMEDDCQGILEHAEGKGAEQQQNREAQQADHLPRLEQGAYRLEQHLGMGRRQMAGLNREHLEQACLIDHARQQDHQQRKQRHDGEQDVVADAAGEQDPPVAQERADHPPQEARYARQQGKGKVARRVRRCHRPGHPWAFLHHTPVPASGVNAGGNYPRPAPCLHGNPPPGPA